MKREGHRVKILTPGLSVATISMVCRQALAAKDCSDPPWCELAGKSSCLSMEYVKIGCKTMCGSCEKDCKDKNYCHLLTKSYCLRSDFVTQECKVLCGGCKNKSEIHCSDLKPIPHGDIQYKPATSPHAVGTVATFNCDVGFKGIGMSSATCLGSGEWSEKVPVCRTQSCARDLEKLEKGRKCGKKCRRSSQCRGSFMTCQCDDWCGKSCFNPNANCPKLSKPRNGYVTNNGRTYGRTVVYGCNDGYTLAGPPRRKCRSDRQWSGYPPTCLPYSTCGQGGDESLRSGKVIRGLDARKGAWPWQAVLIRSNRYSVQQIYSSDNVRGGGTIINDKWILSAAHTFANVYPRHLKSRNWNDSFHIVVGMTAFPKSGLAIPEHIEIWDPESVISHPKFDLSSFDYDVALIRVGRKLKAGPKQKFVVDESATEGRLLFSHYVRPVCMPCLMKNPIDSDDLIRNFDARVCDSQEKRNSFSRSGRSATVTGFGVKDFHTKELSDILQEGRLNFLDRLKCAKSVHEIRLIYPNARFTDRMLCASGGNETSRIDSCQGDSGGPLVIEVENVNKPKYWMIVGIVSWGVRCAEKHPGFYVSVPSVMTWISETMNQTAEINCTEVTFPSHLHYKVRSCPTSRVGTSCSIECEEGYRSNAKKVTDRPAKRSCGMQLVLLHQTASKQNGASNGFENVKRSNVMNFHSRIRIITS